MEHLVKSHMGGYYISNEDPKIIQAYCEVCNSHDEIFKYNNLLEIVGDLDNRR